MYTDELLGLEETCCTWVFCCRNFLIFAISRKKKQLIGCGELLWYVLCAGQWARVVARWIDGEGGGRVKRWKVGRCEMES